MGLQFLWIEANLFGFFLMDVRNSRGKFDKTKEKFVINPTPIATQSSLNAGGSRWTRDLPQNSLNFFTNRSKVQEQGRNTWLFKEDFSPKLWAIGAVVEAICKGRGSGSFGRRCGFQIGMEWATILLQKSHDHTRTGPRSWVDRDLDLPMNAFWWSWRWFHHEGVTITAQSRHDRGLLRRVFPAVLWRSRPNKNLTR